MSYNSKRMITCMAAAIVLFAVYISRALGNRAPASDDLRAWAITILVFIAISVAVMIIIMVLFHIVFAAAIAIKEGEGDVERIVESHTREDERDKLINLKANSIGYGFAGLGFIAALISLIAGSQAIIALHILAGSFAFGSLIEGGVSVYLYERGF